MKVLAKPDNRPLLIFFLLAFAPAWLLMGILIASNYGLIDVNIPLEPLLIVGSWIPNFAAFIVLAFILKKKGGIKKLAKSWLRFRIAPFWYLVLISPVIMALLTIVLYRLIYGYFPFSEALFNPGHFFILLIMVTITGAMGEELGWRGFALPRMQAQMGALRASLVLGLIWELWHVPLWFAGLGFEELPYGAYFITGISLSVLITWACNNTGGSMFVASVFHLTLNLALNMFIPGALPIFAVIITAVAATVVVIYGAKRLSKNDELPINAATGEWVSSE